MADPTDIIRIDTGASEEGIANSQGTIRDAALPNTAVTAGAYTSVQPANGSSNVVSITVDDKGRVTAASLVAMKISGRDYKAAGNTVDSYQVFVSTASPNTSGSDGDIWYQLPS